MSKLAYSIHLGNDKNKTKKAKESKTKNGTSFSNNAIQMDCQPFFRHFL